MTFDNTLSLSFSMVAPGPCLNGQVVADCHSSPSRGRQPKSYLRKEPYVIPSTPPPASIVGKYRYRNPVPNGTKGSFLPSLSQIATSTWGVGRPTEPIFSISRSGSMNVSPLQLSVKP